MRMQTFFRFLTEALRFEEAELRAASPDFGGGHPVSLIHKHQEEEPLHNAPQPAAQ